MPQYISWNGMEWECVIDGNCTIITLYCGVFMCVVAAVGQNLIALYDVNAKNIFTLDNDPPQWHLCHDTRARAWDVVLGRKLFNCENRAYEKKVAAMRPIRHYLHTRAPAAAPSNANPQTRSWLAWFERENESEWARLMPNCDVITKIWQSCVKIRAHNARVCARTTKRLHLWIPFTAWETDCRLQIDRSARRKGSHSTWWEFYLEQKRQTN